ncbi:MAG: hypothetical protein QOF88_3412, partial [Mycobacterium sp.]|nr:hypothetical protein [Mycobacterium sp.]
IYHDSRLGPDLQAALDSLAPEFRAATHLSLCPQCAAEVEAQGQARSALRDSCPIFVPSALLGLLSQIPHHPPPEPPIEAEDAQFADGTTRARRKRR